MKSIKKLRLINWHYFGNETCDIENITFLTGANASGKSTVIDAMQIVLLGDTSGRNFNKAANDRPGRTLKGYLRGEMGETAEGKITCLRPSRFSSYIALEFYDDRKNESFTLGIVFDCYDDDREEHEFFYLKGGFPENNFASDPNERNVHPLSYKELSEYFAQHYDKSDYKFYDTNIAYQKDLKHYLGDLPDKYFTLLKRSVSFSPIKDISSFITEYVCDIDYNIDISSMQQNIQQYKLLGLEAEKIKKKIEELQAIHEAFDEFKNNGVNLRLSDYILDRLNYEKSLNELNEYRGKLDNNNRRLQMIKEEIALKESQSEELRTSREQFLAKKVSSEGYSLASELMKRKQDMVEKVATLTSNYDSILTSLRNYLREYDNALTSINSALLNLDNDILSEDEKLDVEKFRECADEFSETGRQLVDAIQRKDVSKQLIDAFQNDMQALVNSARILVTSFEEAVEEYSDEQEELTRQLSQISIGQKPFPMSYLQIKNALQDRLREHHPKAVVYSFCDMIDITEDRWVNAIEADIYRQKFNFFVDDDYYEEAARYLKDISKEYNNYSFSVIDSERLVEADFKAQKDSVAEIVVSDDAGAKAYANFLLGRVKRCETFREARYSGNGLLPDGSGYRNFGSFQYPKKRWEYTFIGTKVDETSAFEKKQGADLISKKIETYSDLLSYFRVLVGLDILNSGEANMFKADVDAYKEIETLNENIDSLDAQIREGSSGVVAALDQKIQEFDADIQSLSEEKEELIKEQGALEQLNRGLVDNQIPLKESQVNTYRERLHGYDVGIVQEKYGPYYEKLVSDYGFDRAYSESRNIYVQVQNKIKRSKEKLFDLRSRYVATYHLSYPTMNENSNAEYEKELENLSTVMLPKYLDDIKNSHDKAVKQFKDDFIYKLRSSFKTISDQLDELNLALSNVKFGRDSYRFEVRPNKDYIQYYNMIMDDLLLQVGDAEDVFLEKYSETMNELFNMISESTLKSGDQESQIAANVKRFTDYRTYLVFDLLVKKGENAEESSLAKTFVIQSGGETQTPCYISILASFAQLYRTNDPDADTIRLVIFDEAFSKMDGGRIRESIGLLRSFGLQAIISTPTEKIGDIVNNVDTTLVTMHDDKRRRSYIDRYENVKKKIK